MSAVINDINNENAQEGLDLDAQYNPLNTMGDPNNRWIKNSNVALKVARAVWLGDRLYALHAYDTTGDLERAKSIRASLINGEPHTLNTILWTQQGYSYYGREADRWYSEPRQARVSHPKGAGCLIDLHSHDRGYPRCTELVMRPSSWFDTGFTFPVITEKGVPLDQVQATLFARVNDSIDLPLHPAWTVDLWEVMERTGQLKAMSDFGDWRGWLVTINVVQLMQWVLHERELRHRIVPERTTA